MPYLLLCISAAVYLSMLVNADILAYTMFLLASVAQSDECLTGNQKVTGLIPAGLGNILLWRLIMKYFLWSFSAFS